MAATEKPWIKHYAGFAEPETEIPEGSLTDLLNEALQEHSDKTAVTFYGRQISFQGLGQMVEGLAGALHERGVQKGDRVAVMLPNCPQYIVSFFATVRLGATVTQLNPMYVEREIEHILWDSGAKKVIVYADMYPRVKAVQSETGVDEVIVVDLQGSAEIQEEDSLFDDYLKSASGAAPGVEIDPEEDLAALQYTGGTTGLSKGAMLTHRNLMANVSQTLDLFIDDQSAFSNNEKIVGVLPYFHIFGLTCVMMFGIRQGLNQLLVPRFEAREMAELVKREEPVMFAAVPTMYTGLAALEDLADYGFDRIRTYNSGGSALPVELARSFERKTGKTLYEGYGLSEASPVTHFNPPFLGDNREGSIGVPIPSTDSKIVDSETGEREMPVGEPGELVVKGPQVMKGYWGMPEETENTLRDGWLYTGDVARMDEEGYFYIVDRKKDMILASGYNVYPREIEEVLFEHPGVSEAVAVGVPDEYRGESVKAFVVRHGGSATEEEILEFCKERLAPYKVPKSVEFREELPKSTVGKLLRRVLADEAEAEAASPPSPS
ncbi:long-chain-fatty-acid--CoA ligase [Rubrobacter aplysinae]|uniref:long-chain-fatty-acid--CoA ligase n=1 Tax=Rubrobacter aplysinae TaxID=909625 RepID=UPI000ABBB72E|nr:long-chain fatty acid--CoA ligase [Rubrobacter aplysinae]